MSNTTNIRIAGLGGMGVLKSSFILAEILFLENYDVKKSEVHGMAQRGGSVCSDIRFGKKVASPMIPSGELDYLLLFEEADLPLYECDFNKNTQILSASLIDMAQLSNRRSLNIAMLGCLSHYLSIPAQKWLTVIKRALPPKVHAANMDAFALGQKLGQKQRANKEMP